MVLYHTLAVTPPSQCPTLHTWDYNNLYNCESWENYRNSITFSYFKQVFILQHISAETNLLNMYPPFFFVHIKYTVYNYPFTSNFLNLFHKYCESLVTLVTAQTDPVRGDLPGGCSPGAHGELVAEQNLLTEITQSLRWEFTWRALVLQKK